MTSNNVKQADSKTRRIAGVRTLDVATGKVSDIAIKFSNRTWGAARIPAMQIVLGHILVVAMTFEMDIRFARVAF